MKLDPEIHNFYEHLVLQEIHEMELDGIHDDDYLADLCCLALNQLPALYIRHDVDLYSNITDTRRIEMENKVSDAITKAVGWLKQDKRSDER